MSILKNRKLVWMCLIMALIPSLCLGNTINDTVQEVNRVQEMSNACIDENGIFVAKEGSDTQGDGSIHKPYATIKKALGNIKPGETLYIRGGVYTEAITLQKSGKENAYIKICNYPGEEVVLDYSGCNKEIMINLGGQSYIQIEGLELRNNKNKWVYGFYLGGGESHIIIKNNKIHNLYATKPTSSDSGANAIICYGERVDKSINNILIEGNEVYDCNTGWCEAISITGNCEYVSVINNSVRNTGNIGIDFCGNFGYCSDPSLDQPRYCEAIGNVISNENSPNATSYGLYVDGGRDILFERNIIYDCAGGIEVGAEEASKYPTKNIIVRNNLVYNNIENGITVGGYYTGGGKAENVNIYNNTVVNNGKENGELVVSIVDGLQVANNIFYTNQKKALINSEFKSTYTKNISFSHNLYYSGYSEEKAEFEMQGKGISGIENWRKGYETSAIFGKPDFENMAENKYALVKGSLGINSGDNEIEAGELDLNNAIRYQEIIDCGAYEYTQEEEDQNGDISEGEDEGSSGDISEGEDSSGDISGGEDEGPSGDISEGEGEDSSGDINEGEGEDSSGDISEGEDEDSSGDISEGEDEGPSGDISEGEDEDSSGDISEGEDEDSSGDISESEDMSLLPSFSEEGWNIINGATELDIQDDRSISLITPKSWEGVSLWGASGLTQGKTLEIGYKSLGDKNCVQVWADGYCLVALQSMQSTTKSFVIPEDTITVDICIVASKANTAITIQGLYLKEVE